MVQHTDDGVYDGQIMLLDSWFDVDNGRLAYKVHGSSDAGAGLSIVSRQRHSTCPSHHPPQRLKMRHNLAHLAPTEVDVTEIDGRWMSRWLTPSGRSIASADTRF